MTEQDWLNCSDPGPMIESFRSQWSNRKLRLFACGCCWSLVSRLPDRLPRKALVATERFADGEVTDEKLHFIREAVRQAVVAAGNRARLDWTVQPLYAVSQLTDLDITTVLNSVGSAAGALAYPLGKMTWTEIRAEQQVVLRDIFGNPFHPVAVDPVWLTSTVVALAKGIYAERAFDRMPILADALQDAGCSNADILNHCRQSVLHVRGCWVIDLLLEKE